MDLKEIKRITAFARRNGIKSLKIDGFEIEFTDAAVPTPRRRLSIADEPASQSQADIPTLSQINDYIYSEGLG